MRKINAWGLILIILTAFPSQAKITKTAWGWKTAQALELDIGGQWIGGASFDNGLFYEFTLVRLGVGFNPPIGVGVEARLWMGDIAYGEPAASLRLSYSPHISVRDLNGNQLRFTRLSLFVEPGQMFVWSRRPLTRAGVSFCIALHYFLPVEFEAGWVLRDYFERSGPYLCASAGLAGIEQPLPGKGSGELEAVHQLSPSLDGVKAWVGFEFLQVGWVYPDPDFTLRHPVDNLELCLVEAGMGFDPPFGVGLKTRVWAGSLSDWWWGMPFLTLRATYCPVMVYNKTNLGTYQTARLDLFVEFGLVEDAKHIARAGVSADFSAIPWLAPVSVEAGWARFPIWNTYSQGLFLKVSVSAFGGDFRLSRSEENK